MQPTQLQAQETATTVLAALTRRAIDAGATAAPRWYIPESSCLDGNLTSDDDTAVRELRIWLDVLGSYSIRNFTYRPDLTREWRRSWVIEATVDGVSVWLRANVPASLEASPVDLTPVLAVAA